MKAYKIVYMIGENSAEIKSEMKVYAVNLSDAQSTAKTLLHNKATKIIGVVELKEEAIHEKILLCEEVGY